MRALNQPYAASNVKFPKQGFLLISKDCVSMKRHLRSTSASFSSAKEAAGAK